MVAQRRHAVRSTSGDDPVSGDDMASVPVELAVLQEVLGRRDVLVRAITEGVQSGAWDPVMAAFDGLLAALAQLEASLSRAADQ